MTRPIRVLELRSVRGTGGGPEKTILLGAARADRSQFAVTVCYIRDERDPVFAIDEKAAGLPVEYIEIRERHSLDRRTWQALRAIIHDRHIDIVHAHEYKTDFLAWAVSKLDDVIPLATAHGWTGHMARERFGYYPADKRLLRGFPRVVSVSSEIRNELVRVGVNPERITTVPNGIDHRAFRRDRSQERTVRAQLGLRDGDVAVGAVGRLEPQKRFDLLIEAVAAIGAAQPNVKLFIVGDGSLRSALEGQIARLGLADRCRLLGQRTDVPMLHHAFDVFVQSSDYEGTSNAVLEAMALETPVVATDAGGTEDILRDGVDGLVVRRGDLPALASAVGQALSDAGAAATRAKSARRRVETDLSFDTRMATVESIYTELVQERARQRGSASVPAET